jgi:transcriptional regulator GlxA family with amidase domain
MANQLKNVAYVVYPGITMLDLVGIFSILKGLVMSGYQGFTVAETLQPLPSDSVLGIVPDKSFEQMHRPDWLVVMGGGIATLRAMGNNTLRDYVRDAATSAELVIGVSTGALLLAGLGLLDNQRATTHRAYASTLRKLGARYTPERWIADGKFVTCAGGTASIDLALYLLARYGNQNLARQQQLFAEYDPQPPFGSIDQTIVDENERVPIVDRHREDLKTALANYPDLYEKLFSTERIVLAQPV